MRRRALEMLLEERPNRNALVDERTPYALCLGHAERALERLVGRIAVADAIDGRSVEQQPHFPWLIR